MSALWRDAERHPVIVLFYLKLMPWAFSNWQFNADGQTRHSLFVGSSVPAFQHVPGIMEDCIVPLSAARSNCFFFCSEDDDEDDAGDVTSSQLLFIRGRMFGHDKNRSPGSRDPENDPAHTAEDFS
jgi:hypothetical protein